MQGFRVLPITGDGSVRVVLNSMTHDCSGSKAALGGLHDLDRLTSRKRNIATL
jgi:hypothetical protein